MIKNNTVLLSIGMLTLVTAVLLSRYAPSLPVFGFVEGFCYGLSVVMNVAFLIKNRTVQPDSIKRGKP